MNPDVLNDLITAAGRAQKLLGNSAADPGEVIRAKFDLQVALEAIKLQAEIQKQTAPAFDGAVYDPLHDDQRLRSQLGKIFECMMDGRWRTLEDIQNATGQHEASISAQLRHLRKARFGSYVVEKRVYGDRKSGCFQYRLLAPDGSAIKGKVETF